MVGHKHAGTTFLVLTFTSKSGNLSMIINLVEFQYRQLNLLLLMFVLFWCGVILLLTFLGTTTKSQYQMKGRFLLNIIITESSTIFQLFAGEDQSLLIWWDFLLILDFGLHILDRIRWLDLDGDGLAC